MKKSIVNKRQSRALRVLLILLIFSLLVTGCELNNQDGGFFDSLNDKYSVYPSILDYYDSTEYSSFIKLQVNTVYDELYGDSKSAFYILLEGVVVEDYYNKIPKNTLVTIPIVLNCQILSDDKYISSLYDTNAVKNFLQESEYLFVYLYAGMNDSKHIWSPSEEILKEIDSLSCSCVLSNYDILPINEGKLTINSLDMFLENSKATYFPHNLIRGFDTIIYENREETAFIKDIEEMYAYFNSQ